MSKNKRLVNRTISINLDSMTINEAIQFLNSLRNISPDGIISYGECEYSDYIGYNQEINFCYTELETDEEYIARIEREKEITKEKRKEKAAAKKLEKKKIEEIEEMEKNELKRLLSKYGVE